MTVLAATATGQTKLAKPPRLQQAHKISSDSDAADDRAQGQGCSERSKGRGPPRQTYLRVRNGCENPTPIPANPTDQTTVMMEWVTTKTRRTQNDSNNHNAKTVPDSKTTQDSTQQKRSKMIATTRRQNQALPSRPAEAVNNIERRQRRRRRAAEQGQPRRICSGVETHTTTNTRRHHGNQQGSEGSSERPRTAVAEARRRYCT